MKRFRQLTDYIKQNTATVLLWLLPAVLLVPNLLLTLTESNYSIWAHLTNLLLPAGIYTLLAASSRNIGRTTLFFFPVFLLCGFQIVLIYLYGESIIAIDMFLNVVTSNVKEATELLGNLWIAVLWVCVLYIPPIALAITVLSQKNRTPRKPRKIALVSGLSATLLGIVCLIPCYMYIRNYTPLRYVFPANVISNIVSAINRTIATSNYQQTASTFSFHVTSTHPDSTKEVYVLVIGETGRADNWELFGYDRPTNPALSARKNLTVFPKTLSESNTTHKSVPLMLTHLGAETFGDSIFQVRGLVKAFDEAGFTTAWISNQQRNHSLIDNFAREAKHIDYILDDGQTHYDMELVDRMNRLLDSDKSDKWFIVLHSYGSHFNYRERYPEDFKVFTPEGVSTASVDNRKNLLNAYDNTIVYTDSFIDSVIASLERLDIPTAVLYLSDHGEDIFDDERERFLHSSPTPTYWQIHVPFAVWMSEGYESCYPLKSRAVTANKDRNVSSSRSVFHTMMDLAGIISPKFDRNASVVNDAYREPRRLYLNDYNEAVELVNCGLRPNDISQLSKREISRD